MTIQHLSESAIAHVRRLVPDLRDMEIAIAVRKHGSFSKAAASLGLSQPIVTRRIKILEKHLGYPLFVRARSSHTPQEPTYTGGLWLDAVASVLDRLGQILRSLPQQHGAA